MRGLKILAEFVLTDRCRLSILKGSVLEFACPNGAIVNAANEGCLGGGGVDGAISEAGGEILLADRIALPCSEDGIRCPTGQAVLTGPNQYGSLQVPNVIHAVGPNYHLYEDEQRAHELLKSVYFNTLECCCLSTPNAAVGNENAPVIEEVAFSLLSAGVFRAEQPIDLILTIGIKAIHDWILQEDKKGNANNKLKKIALCGYTPTETEALLAACRKLKLRPLNKSPDMSIHPPATSSERGGDSHEKRIS